MFSRFDRTLRTDFRRIALGAVAATIIGCSGGVSTVDRAGPSDAGATEPDPVGRARGQDERTEQDGGDGGTPTCATPNACGGCSSLPLEPKTPCTDGGSFLWVCVGTDSVSCRAPGVPRNVVASGDDPARVHVSWLPPLDMVPDEYILVRDGETVATVPASSTSVDDEDAVPPGIGAPESVSATDGTWVGGVRISWAAPKLMYPGSTHTYQVLARYGSLTSDRSAGADGRRAVPTNIAAYDIEVGGDWLGAGNSTSFEDTGAPLNTILVSPNVWADDTASAVRVRADGIGVRLAPMTNYRVRARVDGLVGQPSAAVGGRRGHGTAKTTQWQRSKGDSDADYTDVPDMTGLEWYDDTAPLDGSGRWYRAVVRTEGAEATTEGQRATLTRYSQVVRADATCAVRAVDRALVCWSNSLTPLGPGDGKLTFEGPFTKLFAGQRHVCAFKDDAHPPVCVPGMPTGPSGDFVSFDPDAGCGLTAVGEVRCADANAGPPADARFRAVAFINAGIGCGLRLQDGHPLCWSSDAPGSVGEAPDEALEDIVVADRTMCGRRKTGQVPVCWAPVPYKVDVPAVPMTMLSGSGNWGGLFLCGIRASDQKVVCFSDAPLNVEFAGIAGPSAESFTSIQVNGLGYCGTLVDGTRACRGYQRLAFEAGGQISFGGGGACILRDDGRLRCSDRALFPKDHFDRVAVRLGQTCAVHETTGKVSCLRSDYAVPSDIEDVTAIALDGARACVLKGVDGKRTCWGPELAGRVPLGTSAGGYSFLTETAAGVLEIRSDNGALEAFPSSLLLPAGSFVAAAGGNSHSCALRASDRLAQCAGTSQPPVPTEAFEEIAAGDAFTCATRQSDRRLRCWGSTPYTGLSASAFKAVAARAGKVCALRERDSTLACGDDLWPTPGSHILREPLRHVAVGPAGEVCFVKYDGHLGCL